MSPKKKQRGPKRRHRLGSASWGRPPRDPNFLLFKRFEELDLDKNKVAAFLGIYRTYLDKLLRGDRRPRPETAWKLAKVLELPLEQVLFPEGPPDCELDD